MSRKKRQRKKRSADNKRRPGDEIEQPLLPRGTIFLEVDAESKKGVSAEAKGLFMVAEGTQRAFTPEEKPAVTTVIEVELPFHIRGLGRTTAVHAHVDGVDYGIVLQTRQRPDQIRRYLWGKDGLGVDIKTKLPLDMEDRWGKALYTLATITFPFFIDLAIEQGSAEQLFEREEQALRAICKVLNFFIENYVHHARYFHLRRLCIHDIDKYSFWHLYDDKPHNITHCFLRNLVHMGETPKLQKPIRILDVGTKGKLIVNAWQSYEYEDYHLAVVNVVIALEVTLAGYKRRTRKLRRPGSIPLRGKPEKCLDTLASHGLDQSLIASCKEGLNIRHRVVHEGLRDVDPTIAGNVINSIQTVCAFINKLETTAS